MDCRDEKVVASILPAQQDISIINNIVLFMLQFYYASHGIWWSSQES